MKNCKIFSKNSGIIELWFGSDKVFQELNNERVPNGNCRLQSLYTKVVFELPKNITEKM